MNEKFIGERITELRIKKNVSEYRMSFDLGHSNSYIRSITSGRALPSMSEFLYICDYFGITPRDFFDDGIKNPSYIEKFKALTNDLADEDIKLIMDLAERLKNK